MKSLHTRFVTKYPWYAKWHAHPHHSKVHYGALIVFIGLTALTLSHSSARSLYGTASTPEAFAEANGLHLLKEGEYAILTNKTKSSKLVKQTVMIKDGGIMTMEVPEGTTMSVLNYDPATPTYVPAQASNLSIRNVADFTDFDGKIDTAVERSLHKKEKVSVIVQLKIPYQKFYDKADSASTRAGKNQSFNSAKASVLASAGASKARDLKIINGVAIEVSAQALKGLQKNPNVQQVVLNREAKAFLDTSVNEINAPYAWGTVDTNGNLITGTGMRIAVIDTGVDYTHPDLGGCLGANCKVIGGWDFINNDADPMDDQGHGTHVAATAAGKGLLNGVAPDAKIIAYKVLNAGGSGDFGSIIAAIDRSVDPNGDGDPSDHVDVGSMSLGATCGTYTEGCGPADVSAQAVNNAVVAGVIYTVAAGNSGPGPSTVGTPGAAQNAITVAAACKSEQVGVLCANPIANFSSRGPVIYNNVDYKKPDIAAPGVLICAAQWATAFESSGAPLCFDDQHIRISGTSMATPHMAGVAALMKQANPSLTPQQIKDRLKATSMNLAGMTYNDQGSGEVNVQTALPLNAKITTTPDLWQVTTDPTKKLSTHTQNFSVKAVDASLGSVTLSASSPSAGITFTPSKTTLNLANLGTDTFSGTLTVDNDATLAGRYTVVVFLMQNGERKGAIPMVVTVTPTISVDKSTVDYGVDDPTLASWNSASQTITITNKRTDAAQTLSVVKGAFPSGVTLQTNATSVAVPANGTATLSSNFTVNNSSLVNGIYNGSFTLSNAANSTKVTTKFVKYFVVTIQNPNQDDIAIITFALQGGVWGNGDNVNISGSTAPVITAYLNKPGTYNIMMWYNYALGSSAARFLLKENVVIGSGTTAVPVSGTAATNKVLVTPIAIDGTPGPMTFSYLTLDGQIQGTSLGWAYAVSNPFYISNVSDNYHLYLGTNNPTATAQNIYMFGGDRLGLSGDWNLTNTPADLKKTIVQHDVSLPVGTQFIPNIIPCAQPGGWFCIGQDSPTRPYPFNQTIYTTLNVPTFRFSGWSDASRGVNHKSFYSVDPYADHDTTVYNNTGPVVWYAGFANTPSQIVVRSVAGMNYGLTRQDLKPLPVQDATPFTIYKNGSVVTTDSLPPWDLFVDGIIPRTSLTTIPASAGVYELRATIPYQSAGVDLAGTVLAQFDTSKSDPNPPYISSLRMLGNGSRSEIYDSAATHTVEISLNPDGGSLSSVTLEMSADSGTFTVVPLTNNTGVYTATLPKVSVTNKVALRMKATDSSGNSLQYTFELPKGTVAGTPPPGDTTLPTVSLTAPANGATLSGTATLTAAANDNIGVTKVDFYQGTTLITSDTTAPYTTTWDTTKVANGSYTLSAKAYDAANNVGTSSVVNVTVSNTVTPPTDTTAPTTSITSPTSGATISGVTTITAAATDNVAIDHVDFYQNTTLIGADASAPYSLSWDTTVASNGSYSLRTKAYDAAGNVGTSNTVSVTVSNSTSTDWTFCANEGQTCTFTGTKDVRYGIDGAYVTRTFSSPVQCDNNTFGDPAFGNVKHCDYRTTTGDTTAPTTTITAPASGATLSGVVTLAASATDNVGVTKVSFYRGTTLIDTDTTGSPDYAITWDTTAVANGSYTLTAKAYDAATNVGTASPITVTVSNGSTPPPSGDTIAPTVSITNPLDGADVPIKTDININAIASDNVGVTKVELFINNARLCTLTGAPYSCAWTVPKNPNRKYTITAKAYDAAGNSGTASAVTVTAKR